MKDLKDYLLAYKQAQNDEEKDWVFRELIAFEEVEERNNLGEWDKIQYLRFTDKLLQNSYLKTIKKFHWIDRKDIDGYIIKAIQDLFNSDKLDLKRSPQEIASWFCRGLIGRVQNQVTKEQEEIELNLSEYTVKSNDDGEIESLSLYDEFANSVYMKSNEINLFDQFIDSIGGIETILSDIQFKIYCLHNAGKTQEQIATELDCSQANVHKHIKALIKRIKKEYLNFRTYRALKQSPDTYRTIKEFIHNYNNIIKFDISDQFDYFGYIINFLKENYKQGEQEINLSIQNNASQIVLTVADVLFDHLKPNEHELFRKVYLELIHNDNKFILTKNEKDKIINVVVRSFNTYLKEVTKNIRDVNASIIDRYDEKSYAIFIDLVS